MVSHVPQIQARLSLHSRHRLRGVLEGEYASVVTGRGIEFSDLREYVRGDDVKDIDWKATARAGQTLVKRYVVIRKHTVQLVVSTSRTMAAAMTPSISKRSVAIEVAGTLGVLATRGGDLVGVVHGNADGQHGLRPATGDLNLERGLDAIHRAITPAGPTGDVVGLLRHVARTSRRRSIVLLVCDEEEVTPELAAALRRLVVQHELLVVTIGDVDPVTVPADTPRSIDVESGWALPAWMRADPELARQVEEDRRERRSRLEADLNALGIVHEHLDGSVTPLSAIRRLLSRTRHVRR